MKTAHLLIVAGALIAAVVVFAAANRYEIHRRGELGALKLDRWTGTTWAFTGAAWREVTEEAAFDADAYLRPR
jgi:hypothetical protein